MKAQSEQREVVKTWKHVIDSLYHAHNGDWHRPGPLVMISRWTAVTSGLEWLLGAAPIAL
jgi:hypothetical protein